MDHDYVWEITADLLFTYSEVERSESLNDGCLGKFKVEYLHVAQIPHNVVQGQENDDFIRKFSMSLDS